MSFILEALKKSENKRRKKSARLPRTIHEPVAYRIPRPRSWTLPIVAILLVNAAVLLWFFGPWASTSRQPEAQTNSPFPQRVEADSVRTEPIPSALTTPPRKAAPTEQKMDAKLPENVSAELPVPRNDRHIYAFQQLPPAIRQQLPVLRMALHAYNRADHRASLIQINNQIYREGDVIDRTLAVEQITEDGAVLRYDGYRFLLPRRGN